MKRLEFMVSVFEKVTAGILFVTAVFISVFYGWDIDLDVGILWQILFLSAVCALGSMILPLEGEKEKEVSRIAMLVRTIIYFIYINAVVLGFGFLFEWFTFDNGWQVLGIELAILFVFVAVFLIFYWSQCLEAKRMNEKLKKRG